MNSIQVQCSWLKTAHTNTYWKSMYWWVGKKVPGFMVTSWRRSSWSYTSIAHGFWTLLYQHQHVTYEFFTKQYTVSDTKQYSRAAQRTCAMLMIMEVACVVCLSTCDSNEAPACHHIVYITLRYKYHSLKTEHIVEQYITVMVIYLISPHSVYIS